MLKLKNLYDICIQENALCHSLAVCLHKNEKLTFTLLLKIFVYFILMMGRAGLGPPNMCWHGELYSDAWWGQRNWKVVKPGSQPANRNYTLTPTPRVVWVGWLPDPPTMPHPGKMGQFREGEHRDSTRQTLREGRREHPALSLKLSDTGFSSLGR